MSNSETGISPLPWVSRRAIFLAVAGIAMIAGIVYWQHRPQSLPQLGAIATVTELSTGLSFEARVDTGAQVCSLHYEELEIPSPDETPENNIGKTVRVKIKGSDGRTDWIETRLVDHGEIRTSSLTVSRYFVHLPLRVEGVEATLLVNLNNRVSMRHPMLIGRNLLRDRFVVDVRRNNTDAEIE